MFFISILLTACIKFANYHRNEPPQFITEHHEREGGRFKSRLYCSSAPSSPMNVSKKETIYLIGGGTRGDCQPLAVTGVRLKEMGYRVVFCAGIEHRGFADDYGLDAYVENTSILAYLQTDERVLLAAESGNVDDLFRAMSANKNAEHNVNVIMSAVDADIANNEKVVAFVASGTTITMSFCLQAKYGAKAFPVYFCPMFATSEYPPFFIDERDPSSWQGLPNPDGSTPGPFADSIVPPKHAYKKLWGILQDKRDDNLLVRGQKYEKHVGVSGVIKKESIAKMSSGDPTGPFHPCIHAITKLAVPHHMQTDALVTGPVFDLEVGGSQDLSSFPEELSDFLQADDAPIYFGWGSMTRKQNDNLVRAAVGTCKRLKMRGIILRGWAELTLDMLDKEIDFDKELIEYAKDGNILFVDKVSHIQLFPRCACTVTHGGMGTFSTMLRSGKPGIITPCWWDQIFTADRIAFLGTGLRGPRFSKITPENLAPLVEVALTDDTIPVRCAQVRDYVIAEKGDEQLAQLIVKNIAATSSA